MSQDETTELLVPLDRIAPVELFTEKNIGQLLDEIAQRATSIVPDMTTAKGRDEIKSVAYRVARTKTTLDTMGKSLVEPLKEQAKVIDNLRKIARDRLEEIQAKVREPVTKYELEMEESEETIASVRGLAIFDGPATSEQIQLRIDKLATIKPKSVVKSMREELTEAVEQTSEKLATFMKERKDLEEFQRMKEEQSRKEAEAVAQKAQEEASAKAAEEAARNAKAEAEANARKAIEEADANARRKIEEADARAKAEAAATDKKHREELARIQKEKDLAMEAERRQKEEQVAREKDRTHRAKINNDAAQDLTSKLGIDETEARGIVEAIVRNRIRHITISY